MAADVRASLAGKVLRQARDKPKVSKSLRGRVPVRGENAAEKARTFTPPVPVNTQQAEPLKRSTGRPAERTTPAYPGEKPTHMLAVPVSKQYPNGLKPIYVARRTASQGSEREAVGKALADQAMTELAPTLAKAPKLAKGVTVAREVGRAMVPVSVLDKVEGKPLSAGTAALDAAFMFPWLRGGRAVKAGAKSLRRGKRAASEKPVPAATVDRVTIGPLSPEGATGATVPPTRTAGGDPLPGLPAGAEQIIEALPGAKSLRREQEQLYSTERGRRAGRAEQAMQVGGREGHLAALRQLKGELPKVKFGALDQFDQATVDEMFTHVQRHGELRTYEKIRTQSALQKVLEGGTVPTRSEIKLLERAFGPEVAAQIAESVPFWSRAKNLGLSVVNVPRSLMSSYDISAPFRQGLVLGARHPRMFASEWRPMAKALTSERAYEDLMDGIASRPTFMAMQDAKLQLTDLQGLAGREDYFMSNLAEQIPLVGRGVRASGRAYTGFLNKFRADAFDNYLRMAEKQGLDIDDPELLKSIARWVNHATGRGSIKQLEGAMVPLTTVFFSPRLIASRLQLLNPAFYATLDPFARKQALQGMAQLLAGISMTLWMAKLAGAEVGMDPRSADFGKIKLGDTRIDIAGGLQQYIVYAARMVRGESVSSTTGEVRKLEGGFGKPSRADITWNFVSNKFAPVPAYGKQWAENENRNFEPFDPLRDAPSSLLPLGVQNAYGGFQESVPAGIASTGLGSIGFGVQTYKPEPGSSADKSSSLRGAGSKSQSLRRGRAKSKSLRRP